MNFFIIMHVESEGPGSLKTFLESKNFNIQIGRLYAGDTLPDLQCVDGIISMGGPMNVYEEERYPFLKEETDFLKKAIAQDIPILGICLGAQMIAKAAGAPITKSPQKEVGWGKIYLNQSGINDILFEGLPAELEVLQWHEDMFHIPKGGLLLAYSSDCPHQAFRYRNAFGLQFHVEITEDMLADWFSDSPDRGIILQRHKELNPQLIQQAERIFANFVSVVSGRKL